MELKWLEDFVSLANTGSFSKSAELRNVSQSAFSRRIHALEDWLGSTLVDRHNHPVSLTDAGTQFIGTANQIIRRIYKTREDIGYRDITRLRPLSIGVADHLAVHFAPSWLQSISPVLGDRKIRLITGLKAGLSFSELLKQQKMDFLLAYGGSVSDEARDSSIFDSIDLDQDELVPVCQSNLTKRFEFPATAKNPLPFINYMPASVMANMISLVTAKKASPVFLKTVIETGGAEAIKALALSGFGIAWLPRIAISEELKHGALSVLGDERHRIPFSIELFRYAANTSPDVVILWEKLKAQT